jgi:hypothetical protein
VSLVELETAGFAEVQAAFAAGQLDVGIDATGTVVCFEVVSFF